jgi:hypothetical protein
MATCASILFIIFIGELHRDPFVTLRDVLVTPDSVHWSGLCTFRVTVEVDGKGKTFMHAKPCNDTNTGIMGIEGKDLPRLICAGEDRGPVMRFCNQPKNEPLPRLPPKKE